MARSGSTPAPRPSERWIVRTGRLFYRFRSYTPIPLVLILVCMSRPSLLSMSAGFACAVAGEWVRLQALRHIGGASRSRRIGAGELVTAGPYGQIRNPLYAGNLLLSGGLAVASGVPYLPPLLFLLFFVQYVPVVVAEEEELSILYADRYEKYAREVPRFLPRSLHGSGGDPLYSMREAVRFDRRSLTGAGLLAAMILFHFFLGTRGA